MLSNLKLQLTKLIALFAVVIAVFCAIQPAAFAFVLIDMPCGGQAYDTEIMADDPDGAIWVNECGHEVEFVVDYAYGDWDYGSAYPYNEMVGPEGNPSGPVYGDFDNPTCNGAELVYVVNRQPVPDGCYSRQRSLFLEPYQFIQLLNNDARGAAHFDNSGSIVVETIRNF